MGWCGFFGVHGWNGGFFLQYSLFAKAELGYDYFSLIDCHIKLRLVGEKRTWSSL